MTIYQTIIRIYWPHISLLSLMTVHAIWKVMDSWCSCIHIYILVCHLVYIYIYIYTCMLSCIYIYTCMSYLYVIFNKIRLQYIYIYIVIHRQTVSFYQNSSVWLDTQDARSRDRNPSNFTLDCVRDHSATKRTTLAKGIWRYFYFKKQQQQPLFTFFYTLYIYIYCRWILLKMTYKYEKLAGSNMIIPTLGECIETDCHKVQYYTDIESNKLIFV